jgi:thiol:disulfide interchange protein
MLHRTLALAAASLLATTTLAQPPAPTAEPVESKPTTKTRPAVYDEKADARQQIAAALAAAKKNNRRVLIQWGGNWCPWCIRMHELMKSNKDLSHELLYEYDLVHIDCGQPNGKNVDLAETYKATVKADGFPYLTILDADGKVLANQETSSLEVKNDKGESVGTKAGHEPKKILDFLKKHEATPIAAQGILDKGLADAKSSGKAVFLHFGAPWCVWCRRMEEWMAKPEVAPLLAKDFIDVKIDQDRNTGGADMLTNFRAGKDGGIPWFAFLDADGNQLTNSRTAKGNIGFPSEPAEIEHFGTMLKKAAKNLTPKDIDTLLASLKSDKSTGR